MMRLLFALGLTGILLTSNPQLTYAADDHPVSAETLCLPGVYETAPQSCLPLGPSGYLTRMAQSGINFPIQPLNVLTPDPALIELPYFYARVRTEIAPVFGSLEDAVAGDSPRRHIEPGLGYITYIDVRLVDGDKYYMIAPGEWMRAKEISTNVAPSQFAGVEFVGTPQQRFGWTVFPVEIQDGPGFNTPSLTGDKLGGHVLVQVYETMEADGVEWAMIGPDEWIQARHIGMVFPNASAPEGVKNGRWIDVNLHEQTMAVYENNTLVFATLISSGVPGWWTRPGLFQITEKLDSTLMTGSFEADRSDYYYLEDVPWTMYFDESRAFHGTYWHNRFGLQQSHGCANLSTGDAQWLFNWASEGDWVYVWDPSGETPEDPALYGRGGA